MKELTIKQINIGGQAMKLNNDQLEKEFLPKFKYDTNLGIITIDEKEIKSVTDVNITRSEGESFAVVTLKFEANVEIEGDVLILPHLLGRECTTNEIKDKFKKSPTQSS